MANTSDVFTPAKLPTVTDVDRSQVSAELKKWASRGGYFVSVLGTTKLGKTTLVKGYLSTLNNESAWSAYLSGQSLQEGPTALWAQLAVQLEIPSSRESGLVSGDRTNWGVTSRFKFAWFPGSDTSLEGRIGGDVLEERRSGLTFDTDPETAVKEVIGKLRAAGVSATIAIDDFHFVTSVEARRNIALALRPLTDIGLTVILSTIHAGQIAEAMANTNLGGRRKPVVVPRWNQGELEQIALKGFPHLSITASDATINKLAAESVGSPQIMQQLCLDLCEDINDVRSGESGQSLLELREPDSWNDFFRALQDEDAADWLRTLTRGPNPRKGRRKRRHPGPPPHDLDGYQLIMWTLHEMDSPTEVSFSDVKAHIGTKLGLTGTELNKLALELKAKNLNALASKDTRAALSAHQADGLDDSDGDELDESADEAAIFGELVAAEAIPQPAFEIRGEQQEAQVSVLDPLLSYTIKWHPEIILESGR
jgi:hypothetical protein